MKPINLNQARKTQERAAGKARADANAAKHGRTKAERLLDVARNQQASDRLSQLKFEDE